MTKKAQATFLWDHQYLIVRKQEALSDEDKEDLMKMCTICQELAIFRALNQDFYGIFEKGITKKTAR